MHTAPRPTHYSHAHSLSLHHHYYYRWYKCEVASGQTIGVWKQYDSLDNLSQACQVSEDYSKVDAGPKPDTFCQCQNGVKKCTPKSNKKDYKCDCSGMLCVSRS